MYRYEAPSDGVIRSKTYISDEYRDQLNSCQRRFVPAKTRSITAFVVVKFRGAAAELALAGATPWLAEYLWESVTRSPIQPSNCKSCPLQLTRRVTSSGHVVAYPGLGQTSSPSTTRIDGGTKPGCTISDTDDDYNTNETKGDGGYRPGEDKAR